MTKNQIYIKINQCNKDISNYTDKINECNKDIEELEQVYSKVSKTKDSFTSDYAKRKNRVAQMKSNNSGLKFEKNFFEGMNELVTGYEFINVSNGLETAKTKVKNKIMNIEKDIDTYQTKLRISKNNRLYWYDQLKYAEDA